MAVLIAQTKEFGNRDVDRDEKTNRRTGTRSWRVFTNDSLDDGFAVLSSSGIPLAYAVHPSDGGCLAIRRRAKAVPQSDLAWIVEVEYSSDYGDPANHTTDPLDRPFQISIDSVDEKKPLERDVTDDSAVTNSAAETFENPITTDGGHYRVTVTKNFSTAGLNEVRAFRNTINNDTFAGEPALCVKLSGFKSQRNFEDTFGEFWARTYTFDVLDPEDDPDYDADVPGTEAGNSPWDAQPLDCGWHTVDLAAALNDEYVLIPCLDRSGQPAKKLLDGGGLELDTFNASPVYLRYRRHRRKDFSQLNLDGLVFD